MLPNKENNKNNNTNNKNCRVYPRKKPKSINFLVRVNIKFAAQPV